MHPESKWRWERQEDEQNNNDTNAQTPKLDNTTTTHS
jgi:hypothetical protein